LVFVTMNEDTALAAEAFRAGASAYVQQSAASELLAAIRQVIEGHSYVTPLISSKPPIRPLPRGVVCPVGRRCCSASRSWHTLGTPHVRPTALCGKWNFLS